MTFSWTHNGRNVTRQSSTSANTSTLTINKVKVKNAGVYVCAVKVGSSSLISNAATLTVFGMYVIIVPVTLCVSLNGEYDYFYHLFHTENHKLGYV